MCQQMSLQFVMSPSTSMAPCQVTQRLCSFWTPASDCIALNAYAVHMLWSWVALPAAPCEFTPSAEHTVMPNTTSFTVDVV